MSTKTIEVLSKRTGKIQVQTRSKEQRTVVFKPAAEGIGRAMCDHDEAEVLLKLPGYWKMGSIDLSDDTGDAAGTGETTEPEIPGEQTEPEVPAEPPADIVEQAVAALDGDAAEQAKAIKTGKGKKG